VALNGCYLRQRGWLVATRRSFTKQDGVQPLAQNALIEWSCKHPQLHRLRHLVKYKLDLTPETIVILVREL